MYPIEEYLLSKFIFILTIILKEKMITFKDFKMNLNPFPIY